MLLWELFQMDNRDLLRAIVLRTNTKTRLCVDSVCYSVIMINRKMKEQIIRTSVITALKKLHKSTSTHTQTYAAVCLKHIPYCTDTVEC